MLSDVEVALGHIYGYGDDDCDDHGWGCVYRGIQTIRRANGLPHMTIKTMRARCGLLKDPVESKCQLWIEPGDARKFKLLPAFPTHVAYIPEGGKLAAFMQRGEQRTKKDEFDHVFTKAKDFAAYLHGAWEAGQPVLIDDKYASFVAHGFRQGHVLIADPHHALKEHRRRRIPEENFFKSGWIAYCLIQKKKDGSS